MSRAPLPPEELIRHAGFLRALGAKLLLDPASIDDATQATLAVGLEQGPREPAKARGWLARVFRNAAGQSRRSEGRRRRRDTTVRGPVAHEATVDAVARHEVMQRVAAAVGALSAPYREVVLLRFYDGFPPRRIAEQLDTPVATIKSRLARALKQLRATLDAGQRRRGTGWRLALAPIAGIDPTGLGHAAAGAIAMKTKTAALAATAAVLAIGGAVLIADPFSTADDDTTNPERMEIEIADAPEAGTPPDVADHDESPEEESLEVDEDAPLPDDLDVREAPKAPPHPRTLPDGSPLPPPPPPSGSPTPGGGVAGNNGGSSTVDAVVQEFKVDDTSIPEALDTLSALTGVEIVVSDEVARKMPRQMSVSFSKAKLRDILRTLAAYSGCSWTERSGVIYFEK